MKLSIYRPEKKIIILWVALDNYIKIGLLRILILCVVLTPEFFTKIRRKSPKTVGKNIFWTASRIKFSKPFFVRELQTIRQIWIKSLWIYYYYLVLKIGKILRPRMAVGCEGVNKRISTPYAVGKLDSNDAKCLEMIGWGELCFALVLYKFQPTASFPPNWQHLNRASRPHSSGDYLSISKIILMRAFSLIRDNCDWWPITSHDSSRKLVIVWCDWSPVTVITCEWKITHKYYMIQIDCPSENGSMSWLDRQIIDTQCRSKKGSKLFTGTT